MQIKFKRLSLILWLFSISLGAKELENNLSSEKVSNEDVIDNKELRTNQPYPSIELKASVMLDYDAFESGFLENADHSDNHGEIRRARIGVFSQLNDYWSTKFKVDISEDITIKDAYLTYTGWKWINIRVGKQKEPFGLEKQMSSSNLFMIERSMISEAIAPGRTIGANLSTNNKNLNWQLGYFQNDNSEKSNALTGRITWAPLHKKSHLFHVGASFSERSLHNDEFRINETLEVHTADSNIEGKKIDADNASLLGSELIWKYQKFTTMTEWQTAEVQSEEGENYRYEGGYIQMSYLLTGGKRKYKQGMLGSINANKDWEATMRYSQLTLKEENTKAKTFTVGVNYLYNKDLKVMANYIHAEHHEENININRSNALSFRIQYRF